MAHFIGNNVNFNVVGIFDEKRILPNRYGMIGSGKKTLSFNLAYYANASPRYLLQGGVMTSFAAFELATRAIGGRQYIQLEDSRSTVNTYSEVMRAAISNWLNAGVVVTDNADTDPIGDSTVDLITADTGGGPHAVYSSSINTTNGESYIVTFVAAPNGYDWIRAYFSTQGFPTSGGVSFNTATGSIGTSYGGFTGAMYPLQNGYYLCIVFTPPADATVANQTIEFDICPADDTPLFTGDGSRGAYFSEINVVKGNRLSSYIKAVAFPATRAKCEAYYAAADIPAWLRDGYKQYIYFDKEDSVMCAAAGAKRVLTSWDATETVTVYLDGADNKIHVIGSVSGQFVESAALSWSLNQNPWYSIRFNNGANCVLTTSGFTGGDGVVEGTAFAAADGDIGFGMNHTAYTEQVGNLISRLEAL